MGIDIKIEDSRIDDEIEVTTNWRHPTSTDHSFNINVNEFDEEGYILCLEDTSDPGAERRVSISHGDLPAVISALVAVENSLRISTKTGIEPGKVNKIISEANKNPPTLGGQEWLKENALIEIGQNMYEEFEKNNRAGANPIVVKRESRK